MLMEMPPVPAGFTVKENVLFAELTPLPLAVTVTCIPVTTVARIEAWRLMLPELPVPGCVMVAVTPDGRLAVSAAGVSYTSEDDHTSQNELGDLLNQLDMRVWDLESRRRLRRLRGHTDSVCGLALSADGRLAVSASRDKTLKVWHTQEGRELRALESHSTAVIDVAVSEDGRLAVSVPILQKRLKVWDVASGHMLRTLAPADDSGSTAVAVTADGRLAVSASEGETLKVWDVESGRELRTLKGHTGVVNGVALSKDGRLAVSASTDHTLKVWDVASGRRLRTIKGHTEKVNGVAMTGDGRLAISRSDDNTLKVWDLETGRELHTFKAYIPTDLTGLGLPLTGLALSNDGRLAVSASTDHTLTEHTLTVWDVASGREFRTLEGHTHVVYGLALSRNGRLAISASWDRTIKVWEVASGAVLATFTCDGPVFRCAWADESRLIVAGDAGGHIHLLRLEEPKREK